MFSSVAQSCPTLRPHELQHSRPPCPSPVSGVHSNSCSSSQWCHPAILSSVFPLLLLPSTFPSIRVFSKQSALHVMWPKYYIFSFSISPSNDYSGSILFYDWLVWFPCCLRHSQGSSPAQRLKSINYLVLSLLYGPILTSIHIESSKSLLPLYTNTQEQFLNVYVTSFPMKR